MAEKKPAGPSLETTESLYEKALEKLQNDAYIVSDAYRIDNYNLAASMFEQVGDFEDAPALAEHCREMAALSEKEAEKKKYDDAVRRMNSAQTLDQQEKVLEQLRELGDYKDSPVLKKKMQDVVDKGYRKSAVKRGIILSLIAAFVIFMIVSWYTGIFKYAMGYVYLHSGSYSNAQAAFEKLNGFWKSEEMAIKAKKEALLNATKDDVIPFGNYKWKVLDREGSELLLIAASIGEDSDFRSVVFSEKDEKADWADSSLRAWLNGEVYENGFTSEERALMILQQVPGTVNETYKTKADGTQDYLTLLSAEDCPLYQDALDTLSLDYYLRTPGENETKQAYISGGSHEPLLFGCPKDTVMAVRPVIRVDLSDLAGEE